MATSAEVYPELENTNTESPAATPIEYTPAASETAPLVVPLTVMLTFGIGWPEPSSVTLPLTEDCAIAIEQLIIVRAKANAGFRICSMIIFWYLSVNLVKYIKWQYVFTVLLIRSVCRHAFNKNNYRFLS